MVTLLHRPAPNHPVVIGDQRGFILRIKKTDKSRLVVVVVGKEQLEFPCSALVWDEGQYQWRVKNA